MNLLVITTIHLNRRRRRRLPALAVQQTAGRGDLVSSREERKARREANKRSLNDDVENKENKTKRKAKSKKDKAETSKEGSPPLC